MFVAEAWNDISLWFVTTWAQLSDTAVILSSLGTVISAVLGLTKWGRNRIVTLYRLLRRGRSNVPLETIRAVPSLLWWHMGNAQGKPAMQIVTRWITTNISNHAIMIVQATMQRRWPKGNYPSEPILTNVITPSSIVVTEANFWIQPPFKDAGESFFARVIFVDNLGNRYSTKKVRIPSE